MKTIFSYLLAVPFFVCCGQPGPKTDSHAVAAVLKDSAGNLAGATAKQPSAADLQRYSNASRHFFDSLFMHGFNGSLLVAKNGEVIYERTTGFKNIRTRKDTLNEHTPFHLASVSKTFTAMGVLKLWEDGKLDIHDDISKYLPGFPMTGITIKNLLTQRSGLNNYVHYMERGGWDRRKFLTNASLLQFINTHKTLAQAIPPGRHFEYCNTNYALLALIIEKSSGQPYAEYITKTFFEPLKMTDSYVFSLSDTARAMKSFKRNGRPYPLEFLDVVYGDKNIYSTTHDLMKWDMALRSGLFFKKTTLDSAYTPYSLEKPGKRNYGLGWRMLIEPNGKKLIYHNGWWHGNRTVFIRMIDEGATIIALCNNDNTRVYASKKLADLFGDYMQGGERFEEIENDPAGRGGENNPGNSGEPIEKAAPAPVKKAAATPVHHHKTVHHTIHKRKRKNRR